MRVGDQIKDATNIKKEELETYVTELNRQLKESILAQEGKKKCH